MKNPKEIEEMLMKVPVECPYSGMTYSEGVEAALQWVLGEMEEGEAPFDD